MLELEPQARAYLLSQGGALTLRLSPRHGCCGGVVGVPVAEVGTPERLEQFSEVEHEGLRVFFEEGLSTKSVWRVGLDELWRWHHLWVERLGR